MTASHTMLGTTQPPPMSVARELIAMAGNALPIDLSHMTVVMPTARVGRRLMVHLTNLAPGGALLLPNIVTPGRLADLLYEPSEPVADAMVALLVRSAAIANMPPDALTPLLPHPPKPDQHTALLNLATQLASIADDLAAHRLVTGDIVAQCHANGIDLPMPQRYDTLDALDRAYHHNLAAIGLVDRQRARLDALTHRRCRFDGELCLAVCPDLPPMIADMVRQVRDQGTNVHVMVFADKQDAVGFDDVGILDADYWLDKSVELPDEHVHIVEDGPQQLERLAQLLAHHAKKQPDLSTDEITLGLLDEKLAPKVEQSLGDLGVPVRSAVATTVGQSRPGLALSLIAQFAESQRFDALAAMLRHPDLQAALARRQHDDTQDSPGVHLWTHLLDQYTSDTLALRHTGSWLGNAELRTQLGDIWQAVHQLVFHAGDDRSAPDTRQPWSAWAPTILRQLELLYPGFGNRLPMVADAIDQLRSAIGQLGDLPADIPAMPRVTLGRAIALLLAMVRDQPIAPLERVNAIDALGWLEMLADDATHTILLSANEPYLPASSTSDALLPNAVRQALGMLDNQRRLAREIMTLRMLGKARQRLNVICTRRDAHGQATPPSRLLLRGDDANTVSRMREFARDDDRSAPRPMTKPRHRERDNIGFVMPQPLAEPIDKLPVTAFRSYLACPYRFYLRYVLKLEAVGDQPRELDAMAFGSLTHDVLERFAKQQHEAVADHDTLTRTLVDQLHRLYDMRFGRQPRPALRIQLAQLEHRLTIFAAKQASLFERGWRIMPEAIERSLQAEVVVDDKPITITGRIDRVDYHPELGLRLIDYKTGDTAKTPAHTHNATDDDGNPIWTDLQLPMYRHLIRPVLAKLDIADAPISLAYFNLPKDPAKIDLAIAQWDEADLSDADATGDRVIRNIRSNVFWPPADVPDWSDEYAWLCLDDAANRAELIGEATESMRGDT